MRSTLAAVMVSAALAGTGFAQTAVAPATSATVVATEEAAEPIPVPQEAPGGSSTPMGVSAGVGVGVVVIGVGLIIACGIVCFN